MSKAVLENTPAVTVLIAWKGSVLMRSGRLPSTDTKAETKLGTGPIASRLGGEAAPVYLPALQNLPGRIEFAGWLPENTPSAVLVALGTDGLILVGGDRPRAFTQRDLGALFLLAQPLTRGLESC